MADCIPFCWPHTVWLTAYHLVDRILFGWLHTGWLTSCRLADRILFGWTQTGWLTAYRLADLISFGWPHTMCLLIFWPPGRRVIPQQLTVQWCYLESNAAFLNVKQEHKVRPKTDTANSAILGRLQKIWKQLPYLYWDLMTVESSTYLTVMLCIVGRKRIKWS